jgi:hypothetical protein
MFTRESAKAIVAEATKSRSRLADLDHALQSEIDEIVLGAARAGRPMSDAEKARRKALRASQSDVGDAFTALAFATLARLNQSADVVELKGKLDTINANLVDDLDRLKNIARYAAVAAKVADGLTKLAEQVAGALA